MKPQSIEKKVSDYYSSKIIQFGANHAGVDWNSEASQFLRFEQLIRVLPETPSPFSIIDYGCGYGALRTFLAKKYSDFEYTGYDISQEMLVSAQSIHKERQTHWINNISNNFKADFLIASGIFNVKLDTPTKDWQDYILNTLNTFNQLTKKGFSYNILTSYSDKEYLKDHLYYAEPEKHFAYCKQKFSQKVSLIHDYPLYEFTIIVRK